MRIAAAAVLVAFVAVSGASATRADGTIQGTVSWTPTSTRDGTLHVTWSGVQQNLLDGYIIYNDSGQTETGRYGSTPTLVTPCPRNTCGNPEGGGYDFYILVETRGGTGSADFTGHYVPPTGQLYVQFVAWSNAVGTTCYTVCISSIMHIAAPALSPTTTTGGTPTSGGGTSDSGGGGGTENATGLPRTVTLTGSATITHAGGGSTKGSKGGLLQGGDVISSASSPVRLHTPTGAIVLDKNTKLEYETTGKLANQNAAGQGFETSIDGGWKLQRGTVFVAWNQDVKDWLEGPHGTAIVVDGEHGASFTMTAGPTADTIRCYGGVLDGVGLVDDANKGIGPVRPNQQVSVAGGKFSTITRFKPSKSAFWK